MRIFAGTWKNRLLKSPKGLATRPTMGMVREALFNICQQLVEGASFLDLFAGSGAMGLEALSHGATQAVFVDSSRECVQCIQENVKSLGVQAQTQILQGDVFQKIESLEKMGKSFDIIYADPPYEKGPSGLEYGERIVRAIDESALLKPGGLFFLEGPHPFPLKVEKLKSLTWHKTRHMGRATLQQYQKKEAP